jgi:hypothetical protein
MLGVDVAGPFHRGVGDPAGPGGWWIPLEPELHLCEIISPSTARIDRSREVRIDAREGVSHLWLVDPQLETLESYRLEAGRWVVLGTHAGDDVVRAEPFDAVDLRLVRRWIPRSTGQ